MAVKIRHDELIPMVIDILKKNKETASLLEHPGFEVAYLRKITEAFFNCDDLTLEDNKISGRKKIENPKGDLIEVFTFSLEKIDYIKTKPTIKYEAFEHQMGNLVKYMMYAHTAELGNEQ